MRFASATIRCVAIAALTVALVAGCALAQPAASLEQGFQSPPDSAKPHNWWHWMNGNITKEGITADLEAMKRAGIGGAQIFDVTDGIIPGTVDYMSDEWRGMVKHAIQEADRLGIEICMHNCAGWSSSGGPWITPELAMQMVVMTEVTASGPALLDQVIPQPETRNGYYKDIAVLAFPTPAAETTAEARQTPTVSASQEGIDAARLVDGNRGTACVIPMRTKDKAPYVQFDYAQPFTARSMVVSGSTGRQGARCELQVSKDGKEFAPVTTFTIPEPGVLRPPLTVNFEPATGRVYRLSMVASRGQWGNVSIGELTLTSGFRVSNIAGKAGYSRVDDPAPDSREAPADAAIELPRVVDISAKMAADGRLTWDVPAGDWTILRIGHTPTGKDNHPAPEPGRGLECDKLSSRAADVAFDAVVGKVITDVGPLAGKTFNNVLIDSYEVDTQNWTPLFADEFAKRRGYDLLLYLPVMTGRLVTDLQTTERVLWDIRRTIADLYRDNYFGRFAERLHEHGMLLSVEPYGNGGFEDLGSGGRGDIPMTEFWAGGGASPYGGKLASSIAQVYGRKFVGAESFTADPDNGAWRNHPGNMKQLGDFMYTAGVNRFIFHRYCHQPWMNLVPGMTMGPHGFHWERTSTWFDESPTWMRYLTRCQYMLQEGLYSADVLCYTGEGAPKSLPGGPAVPAGFGYSAISTDALLTRVEVKGGRLVLPDGMSYRVLTLPDRQTITPETLSKIRDLVAQGAVLVGPRPLRSPSLDGYPECDLQVQALADEVWGDCDGKTVTEHALGKGRVVWGKPLAEVLAGMGVAPDFEYSGRRENAAICHIHRTVGEAEVYFLSNQSPRAEFVDCTFRVSGKLPELWSPETGATETAPVYVEKDGRTAVSLRLDPAGSVFVVFRKPAGQADPITVVSCDGTPLREWKPAWTPELKITSAIYGVFTVEDAGLVDVTAQLRAMVRDDKLTVTASNSIAGDPASMIVKQLRIDYTIGGKDITRTIDENRSITIPTAEDPQGGPLVIRRALYGVIPEDLDTEPATRTVDVTDILNGMVKDGTLLVRADNALAGDPAQYVVKQLRVQYTLDGQAYEKTVGENSFLSLPDYTEATAKAHETSPAEVAIAPTGKPVLTAWAPGSYEATTASGARLEAQVGALPKPVSIDGPWDVSFPPNLGAPEKAVFPKLISWPDSEDKGIKYFSGTATYTTRFDVPGELVAEGTTLSLDLGSVREMARVKVNGKDLGLLWHSPFRVDVTSAVRAGGNELQVEVTNLWPNRLIGDEQLPPDCEWNGPAIKAWPDWLLQGKPRPNTGRIAFTTWRHYTADSPLLPSGLLGPVAVRVGKVVPLAAQ